MLSYIRLSKNQLIGTIPNFDKLPKLTYFYADSNQITGTIPNFNNLPKLYALYLQSNKISNSIPNFDKLPELQYFFVSHNQLSGNIPDLSNCKALLEFKVDSNQFTFENLLNFKNSLVDFKYAPQMKFYKDTTISIAQNKNLAFDLKIDPSLKTNSYTWINTSDSTWTMDPTQDKLSNLYTFKNIQFRDAGKYIVKVKNDSLPLLTLESNLITLAITTKNSDLNAAPKDENINCFANPVRDYLTCEYEGQINSIHLTSVSGQSIDLTSSFKKQGTTIEIDFDKISSGAYTLQLNTSNGNKKTKIIVMK